MDWNELSYFVFMDAQEREAQKEDDEDNEDEANE